MSDLSRKDFLSLAWKGLLAMSGALGLAGLLRYLGYRPDPAPQTTFDLGPAENYPPGSSTVIPAAQAILVYDGTDFQALSLVCPHLGCQVEPTPDGFTCPCHGSQFAPSGALLRGPSDQPLRTLRVEQTSDGRLVLYTQAG
jgi:cytochrome b6-f complex iron-sulfur subunit